MPEAGATALIPRCGRLEWLGPIPAEPPASLPVGPVGRALDLLDIVAARALSSLFDTVRR